MTTSRHVREFAYEAGEEVVLRLDGADAFDVGRGLPVPSACLAAWTIGTIVTAMRRDGAPAYAVRFLPHGDACVCAADERAIEGIA
jgi:hypothetical protein